MQNLPVKTTPSLEQALLREIDRQFVWANDVFQETASQFYEGRMDALDSLRRFIMDFYRTEPQIIDFISLEDSIEPGDDVLDRIVMKIGEIGGTMKAVNFLAISIA